MQLSGIKRPVGEVVVRRGDELGSFVDGDDLDPPAWRFSRVYGAEVFSLLGLKSFSYSLSAPDEVKLRFQGYDFARFADHILKDVVLGARLVLADEDGNPFDMRRPAEAWAYDAANLARGVAAMPGVTSYRWFSDRAFMFETTNTDVRVKLQQLVERKLAGEWTGFWAGECFGPGCPPDPAPPTGEA